MTLRGFLILLGSIYLVALPGRTSADLVAQTLGGAAIAVFLILLLITVLGTILIRRKLTLSLHTPSENLVSKTPLLFVLQTSRLSVPPLFAVELRLKFKDSQLATTTHLIEGLSREERRLTETITFPHRGYWRVDSAEASFGDLFGFTALRWKVKNEALTLSLRVAPPSVEPKILPILSSSERSGDLLPTHHNRSGDAFDLKPYHPSDGMRRIAWKIYARSGELISRHPEPSMTPEGTVVIYSLLDKEHDQTASSVLTYLRQLEELDLDIFFACSGFRGRQPKDGAPSVAMSAKESEDLLIESAFVKSEKGSEIEDLKELLQEIRKFRQLSLSRVLLFIPPAKCSSEADIQAILGTAKLLEESAIKPVFILQGEGEELRRTQNKDSRGITDGIAAFFLERQKKVGGDIAVYRKFITVCAGSNWQVIL